jgi:hypothetical protein
MTDFTNFVFAPPNEILTAPLLPYATYETSNAIQEIANEKITNICVMEIIKVITWIICHVCFKVHISLGKS